MKITAAVYCCIIAAYCLKCCTLFFSLKIASNGLKIVIGEFCGRIGQYLWKIPKK